MIQFFYEDFEADVKAPIAGLIPAVEKICADHGMKIDYLNVVFMSDEQILEMNRDFLQHDYYTDIISFNYADKPEESIEGELYISVDRVKDNAQNLGLNFDEELRRVVIHGTLHFCGYGDKEEMEKILMQSAEDKYINEMFHVKHRGL